MIFYLLIGDIFLRGLIIFGSCFWFFFFVLFEGVLLLIVFNGFLLIVLFFEVCDVMLFLWNLGGFWCGFLLFIGFWGFWDFCIDVGEIIFFVWEVVDRVLRRLFLVRFVCDIFLVEGVFFWLNFIFDIRFGFWFCFFILLFVDWFNGGNLLVCFFWGVWFMVFWLLKWKDDCVVEVSWEDVNRLFCWFGCVDKGVWGFWWVFLLILWDGCCVYIDVGFDWFGVVLDRDGNFLDMVFVSMLLI